MNIFELEIQEINKEFPKLKLIEKSEKKILAGDIELLSENGEILDVYKIEIHPTNNYPFMFPKVYEKGGKIPLNVDWHIYEDDSSCCIKIQPEEYLICINGITLSGFIKNELIPYLFNQTFRRENGYFIKERSHGVDGLIEFYGEKLRSKNISEIIKYLKIILYRQEPNRVAKCFCGSKNKYRKCHRDSYNLLTKIEISILLLHLNEIIKHQKTIVVNYFN